ncbi:MAG TPA: hypothetical protein VKB38_00190 [Terracidiphilus sp.]|nr:hypothetical protein [Terracidiphilus sp.]
MRSKRPLIALAAALFLAAPFSLFSQVVESATGPVGRPLSVGAGMSYNFLDLSKDSHMPGIAVWADWRCFGGDHWLNRLAIEAEGRDVHWNPPPDLPNLRVDTIQGGVNILILSGNRTRFYAKGLAGVGSADVPPDQFNGVGHKTEDIYSLGEGLDLRLNRFFSAKLEVETQIWPHFFPLGSALTPSSITVGVQHTFGGIHREAHAY